MRIPVWAVQLGLMLLSAGIVLVILWLLLAALLNGADYIPSMQP